MNAETLRYLAYGLTIESEFAIPEFRHSPVVADSPPDLRIIRAQSLDTARFADSGEFVIDESGRATMRVDGLVGFSVRGGNEVLMCLEDPSDEAFARLFLLGSVMGMIFHQREWLVMHASAVRWPGGKVDLFVGDSGAGKSTLAAALVMQGCELIADDLVPVRWEASGPRVWPGPGSFKLWGESLDALGLERSAYRQISRRHDKYHVPSSNCAFHQGYPVDNIFQLGRSTADEGSIDSVAALEAIRIVASNTYRAEYVQLLGRANAHFEDCVRLAKAVSVRRFMRPWSRATLHAAFHSIGEQDA